MWLERTKFTMDQHVASVIRSFVDLYNKDWFIEDIEW
jgi:hypothetical protein